MEILGIDIGGSGIKGAPVDTTTGALLTGRYRIATPHPATPDAVIKTIVQLVQHFGWEGPIGCTFPAIIKNGRTLSAANVDHAWIGFEAEEALREATGQPILLINDADAAGIAEMKFGAGRGHDGVVFILTLGTGIGSAIFMDGLLLPNSELGHLEFNGKDAEERASDRIRQKKDLSWKKWAEQLNSYLSHLEFLFSPDMFILGGGVSKKFDKFGPYLTTQAITVPAQLRNEAGIVGAALAAQKLVAQSSATDPEKSPPRKPARRRNSG